MDDQKKQNRREFLLSSTRKAVLGALAFMGISLGYKTVTADKENSCEVNLPCRNCFKLGNCAEDKAAKMRQEIKQPVNQKNGNNNG